MSNDVHREWAELERAARAWLEQPPQRSGVLVELHAVVLPSFEDGIATTLALPGPRRTRPPLGVRRVWRRPLDAAKVENPVARLKHGPKLAPTFEECEVELPTEAADALARRAAALLVAARGAPQLCLDGLAHVLCLGELFASSRFEWHGDPPPGWEGLAAIARELAELVEGELA